jgi:hypothetical protein
MQATRLWRGLVEQVKLGSRRSSKLTAKLKLGRWNIFLFDDFYVQMDTI